MKNWRMFGLIGFLLALFIFLQYRLWFESGGIIDMRKLQKTLAEQTAANDTLKKSNEELLFQVERLKKSHDSIESRARNELGMIKKDEVFYQVVKKPS